MRLSKTKQALAVALSAATLFLAPLASSATPKSLAVGVFSTADGAEKAYKDIKTAEKTKLIEMDAFAVVSRDDKGDFHVKNTQRKDMGWGAVAGGVVGLLVMGPVGAAAGAGVGGLGGWLTGKAVGIPKEDINNIKSSLTPNSSAIVAVIDNKWVADVEKTLRAEGTKAFIKAELEEQQTEQPAAAH